MATTSFMVWLSFPGLRKVGHGWIGAPGKSGIFKSGIFRCEWHKKLQTCPKKQWLRRTRPIALYSGREYPSKSRSMIRRLVTRRGSLLSLPQRAFLRDRGHQRAVLLVDHAAGQGAAVLRARRILRIKQPFVGAERAMKPHRVIEAGRHQALVEQGAAVTRHRRIEQREVRRIGQRAHM